MENLDILKTLRERLKEIFSNEKTGHDISHLERVLDYALAIQKVEGGDLYVIAVSALIHDIHRIMSNELGRYVTPKESIDKVKEILLSCNISLNKLDKILFVVENYENKGNKNLPLEALIIQDADALDNMGEVGLQRTLTYCKTYKIPITNPNVPLNDPSYAQSINPISTCHYVYNTMIKEGKNLYTKTARELSQNKIAVLEQFVKDNYNKQV